MFENNIGSEGASISLTGLPGVLLTSDSLFIYRFQHDLTDNFQKLLNDYHKSQKVNKANYDGDGNALFEYEEFSDEKYLQRRMDLKGMDQAKDGSFLKLADVRANVEKRIFLNPTTSQLITTTALDAILRRDINCG